MPSKARLGARTPTKEAIRRFLRYSQRFTDNTQRQYRDTLYRFCDAMPDVIELITPEHLDRYIGSLNMNNNSKNTKLIPIRSLFRYLENYYDIPNVAQKVKDVPRMPSKQRVISSKEYRKILQVAKPLERAVIKFLANTGLRASEFGSLTPQNISPDQKYLTVIGKGNKRRTVPLNQTCRDCLPMIFSKSYKNRNSLYRLCLSLSKQANLESTANPHSFRHYWETELIRKGIPISLVAKIAGHSVEIAIKIYSHICHDDILGLTDVLDS